MLTFVPVSPPYFNLSVSGIKSPASVEESCLASFLELVLHEERPAIENHIKADSGAWYSSLVHQFLLNRLTDASMENRCEMMIYLNHS